MPFQITTQPFGPLATEATPLTEYVLEHTESGEYISVIPEHGAILRRLILRKGNELMSLIQAPESPQALLANESYASAFLYPFASRVRHGVYHFEGADYTLPINETRRYNAIHGLVHGQPFTVESQDVTSTHAQLVLRYDYAGDLAGYPFPFSLTITYELIQADLLNYGSNPEADRMCALRISYAARNAGTKRCPAAFGWHPYFTFSGEDLSETTLSLPARSRIDLDEDMMPGGRQPLENAETFSLRDVKLDTPFAIEPTGVPASGSPFAETMLTATKTGVRLIVGQEVGEGKLNYLVCFTPPRHDSLAIEPYTANVNAFNTGEGLVVLNPGETMSGTMWIRLE
ncbi:aldose 1-epimerase family protein [Spirosoma knui]